MHLIEQGLNKSEVFEQTGLTIAVNNATFSVYQGEIFVVMGLSGSGKSTLVRMLNRLIDPTSGSIFLEGRNLAKMNHEELKQVRRNKLCMVFQSFALMPHMTVLRNTALGLELSGMERKEREKKALQALEQVGLKAYADSYPTELSGGMQQRVGLARALSVDPSIMLMDEAFSALDPLIRSQMQDELLMLHEKRQRTIIFISHDLDEAMRIGDRIAMMDDGCIVQVGTPEEILMSPANEYVRAFFRGVSPTDVLNAGDLATKTHVTVVKECLKAVYNRLLHEHRDFAYVLDTSGHFRGIVSIHSLHKAIKAEGEDSEALETAFVSGVQTITHDASVESLLPVLMKNPWPIPVVNEANIFQGTISKNRILSTLMKQDTKPNTQETG
jgi:glycine betaine/proline transport system ATP-binding protein